MMDFTREGEPMRRITNRILGIGAAVMLSATLASAQAPDTNRTTIVTFSAPVSLPGVTLPAGSYLFKLADSQVNRNIVQVFDKDRSKIFATILAIPAQRNEPADETVVTFRESPANAAPAVQYWYYPGERTGQEFAYPKRQAMEIANAAKTSVLSIDAEASNADAMKNGTISRVEPGENAAQSSTAPSPTAQPSSEQPTSNAQMATTPNSAAQSSTPAAQPSEPAAAPSTAQPTQAEQPTTQQPSSTTPSTSASSAAQSSTPTTPGSNQNQAVGTSGTRENLPKTASTLPLVGFAGMLALISAFGVRALRRARA